MDAIFAVKALPVAHPFHQYLHSGASGSTYQLFFPIRSSLSAPLQNLVFYLEGSYQQ
jgi:hypothetical protein